MNYIAPAGTPIRFRDIFYWLKTISRPHDTLDEFKQAIQSKFEIKHCFFISSGRAAIYSTLRCLARLAENNDRQEVVIPSYTCYSIPAAIYRAGLKVRVCDISPETLSYDLECLESLDFNKVLAVVTANLYGIPNDLSAILRITSQHGVYLIDDAAQSMGAISAGQYAGTFGNVGIYSLDKGKNITSIQGGIIVTNSDDIAHELSNEIDALAPQSTLGLLSEITKLFVYAMLLPPKMYWITRYIPFLNLGTTVYTMDYPVRKYSSTLGVLAFWLFTQIDEINASRRENANWLYEHLRDMHSIKFIHTSADVIPVYLRLPLLIQDPHMRDLLIKKLNESGIGATASYPKSIVDIPDIQDLLNNDNQIGNGARYVAEHILTLPTHPYVTDKHLKITIDIIKQVIN
jgi:perosamine synthetase